MEEVDKIIIESLKHLECDIDPEIENLKQFDADMVLYAVSSCLEVILQTGIFPKKMPPSMSARLKLASSLAEQIRDLGFRGDMGYQTILYCNEEEVRRVLMFLIERLPRDTAKNVPFEQVGYVPRIVKSLEENIKESLSKMWVPTCFLRQGTRESSKGYTVHSMGDSCLLQSKKLVVPASTTQDEDLKHYWVHFTPDVTKQCSPRELIPSLLFCDNEISEDFDLNKVMKDLKIQSIDTIEAEVIIPIALGKLNSKLADNVADETNGEMSKQNTTEKLSQELDYMKNTYVELQKEVKKKESQLFELITVKNEEESQLRETLAKVKLKTKTATVLSKEENLAKLNNMIQNSNDRLAELAKQWNKIQQPLLDEYRALKNSLTDEESKFQDEKEKLENLKDTEEKLQEDLKEKKILSQNLLQQYQQISRTNNRTMYTRRILEIIANINKQNNDIQNVLKDTRQIQKEIKNLTGQVDRSFTLADELIFYDAKQDETARRSYKLLAALRDEFSSVLKTLEDLGIVERECRNLEEQIEIEKPKDVSVKLERIYSDLHQIKKEIQILKEQSKS